MRKTIFRLQPDDNKVLYRNKFQFKLQFANLKNYRKSSRNVRKPGLT